MCVVVFNRVCTRVHMSMCETLLHLCSVSLIFPLSLPLSDSLSSFFLITPFDDETFIAMPGHETNCGRETESTREKEENGKRWR